MEQIERKDLAVDTYLVSNVAVVSCCLKKHKKEPELGYLLNTKIGRSRLLERKEFILPEYAI
jgi:hypothetical protein